MTGGGIDRVVARNFANVNHLRVRSGGVPLLRSDFNSLQPVDQLGLLVDFWALRPRGQAADGRCARAVMVQSAEPSAIRTPADPDNSISDSRRVC